MNKLKSMNKASRTSFLTYLGVILAFAILQPLSMGGKLSPNTPTVRFRDRAMTT